MDPSNPAHVQHLLNTLNEEDEDEDDEGQGSCGEGERAGQPLWTQLPSAVTWAGQTGGDQGKHLATMAPEPDTCRQQSLQAPSLEGESGGGQRELGARDMDEASNSSCFQSASKSIPHWAQVSAPEFRPGAAGPVTAGTSPAPANNR